ncbi:MAG: hypothetical protein ACM3SP_11630 [Chloroflexota bacterium]
MASSLILGLWLMISPFTLALLNRGALKILSEDLLLGFGIATFSLCRLLARREGDIVVLDWLVTALGFLTLINPFLYRYFNLKLAAWNTLSIGGAVFLLALFQDWKDSDHRNWAEPHQHAR